MFFLEAGINHFGDKKEIDRILKFFLKSSFQNITFMLQTDDFYHRYVKKGINFKLDKNYYNHLIEIYKKNKKKIGLSVCDIKTFDEVKDLKFDFYKLLSISINNFNLINILKSKKKPIFISTGFNSNDKKIKKAIKSFDLKKNLTILHTPMTYNVQNLNFKRILRLREKFNLPVGYSNHNSDSNSLNILSAYAPSAIFIYIKPTRKKKRVYPDDKHALYLDELETMKKKYEKYLISHEKIKTNKKVTIFNEIKK